MAMYCLNIDGILMVFEPFVGSFAISGGSSSDKKRTAQHYFFLRLGYGAQKAPAYCSITHDSVMYHEYIGIMYMIAWYSMYLTWNTHTHISLRTYYIVLNIMFIMNVYYIYSMMFIIYIIYTCKFSIVCHIFSVSPVHPWSALFIFYVTPRPGRGHGALIPDAGWDGSMVEK